MSGRSTLDSRSFAGRQHDSSFNYWLQQGQVIPLSQGELSLCSPAVYALPSTHPAHPPIPHRPTSFSNLFPAATGTYFPLYSPRSTNASSRTLSQGTLYQESSDDSTQSSSPPYLASSNDSLSSGITSSSTPTNLALDARGASYSGPLSKAACPPFAFPSVNSRIIPNQGQPSSFLAHGKKFSPPSTQVEHSTSGVRQQTPVTLAGFPYPAWHSEAESNTSNALFAHGYDGLQFDNTFAPTRTIQSQDLCPSGDLHPEITEHVKHNPAKRRRVVSSPETSKRRTTSRRHRENGSRSNIGLSVARNVLQGTSQEDCFNVHIWHQVEGRPPRTARSTFGPERRLEVAQVREIGACFDCRFSKQRVRKMSMDVEHVLNIA